MNTLSVNRKAKYRSEMNANPDGERDSHLYFHGYEDIVVSGICY